MKLADFGKLEPTRLEERVFFDHPSGKTRVETAMRGSWRMRMAPLLNVLRLVGMVRDRGLEPLTPSVSRKCSTTELTARPYRSDCLSPSPAWRFAERPDSPEAPMLPGPPRCASQKMDKPSSVGEYPRRTPF